MLSIANRNYLVRCTYDLNSINLQIDDCCVIDAPPKFAQCVLSIQVPDQQDDESRSF
ncbi:MAG: hypothetical protein CM1200mP18_04040 [Gammaproteobacteria bacterium]|nr:MAG: hypothetical protein CM1200mP18_04040 [Gammaproteobacteria bacterium]